jgi:nucleoside-diphosphate-sugar epimerase
MNDPCIALVGGAGFIGNQLARLIVGRAIKVKILDSLRLNNGHALLELANNPLFEFVYGDARNERTVRDFLDDDNVQGVCAMQGLVGIDECKSDTALSYELNVYSNQVIMRARRKDIPLVFCSTCCCYGEQDGVIKESNTLRGKSVYAQHKIMAEQEVLAEENTIVYRFTTAINQSAAFRLNLMPNSLMYDGVWRGEIDVYQADVIRNFIAVEDMASALFYGVWCSGRMKDRIYNVGAFELTKRELAEKISVLTGCRVNYRDDGYVDPDSRKNSIDCSLMKSTGWAPWWGANMVMQNLHRSTILLKGAR